MSDTGKILVISGPSAVGKNTIFKGLMEKRPTLWYSVSYTTRKRRKGEVEGKDYFFIDKSQFWKILAQGLFLEWEEVHGNLYGTPRKQLDEAVARGEEIALILDIKGALELKELGYPVTTVFLVPPSEKEWIRRLNARQTENNQSLQARIDDGKKWLESAKNYDKIIIADGVENPVKELEEILDKGLNGHSSELK